MTCITWDFVPSLLCLFVINGLCSGTTVNRNNEGLTAVPGDLPTDTTVLRLRNNSISSLGHCEFCSLTVLDTLDLSKNDIAEIEPTAFNGTQLSVLDLSYNQLTTVPSALGPIATTLLKLSLLSNEIEGLSDTVFLQLANLQTLHIHHNRLNEDSIDDACFNGLKNLKILSLGSNRLTGDIFSRISVLSSTLEYLTLKNNNFGSMHPELFVETMNFMRGLETLSLKNTGLSTLPDFYHNNGNFSLLSIDITRNPLVCDEKLVWLKEVEEDPCLSTTLYVSPCDAPLELEKREWNTLTRRELDPPGNTCLIRSVFGGREMTLSALIHT